MAKPASISKIRAYRGDALRMVAFPLGGIGTGTISLGGRGNLRDWEIFNHPAKGRSLPYTFFSIWAQREGDKPVARVLERKLLPPYVEGVSTQMYQGAGFGLSTAQLCGLPRLDEVTFQGGYPMAWLDFEDARLPLQVSLEAFNPMVPMDERASSMPLSVFRWTLHNPTDKPVTATLAFSLLNACGYDGTTEIRDRHHAMFGGAVNELVRECGLTGLRMSNSKLAKDHRYYGTMAVATTADDVTWLTNWERAGWWDDAQYFWDDFADDGRLPNGSTTTPSPDGETDVGSIGACVTVAPGQSVDIPFYLSWHFPNLVNDWNGEEAVKGKRLGNWYATQWPDAWAVLTDYHAQEARLAADTQTYVDTLFESTLPEPVLDAVSATSSIMRTTTCLRTEDGRFNAFEGCGDSQGCCPMNCTHVWNYVMAVAHLYPSLERSVRLTDFQNNLGANGDMAFRTLLPLVGERWVFKPAADGQMGTIMKVYREWLQCGDRVFLEQLWPAVVNALEFAWQPGSWDADRDGVMEGEQHNTFDIEFHGPNTMCGLFYLGALRAAEEMARALGHSDKADEYHRVFESGSAKYAKWCWNGDYFIQRILPPGEDISTLDTQPKINDTLRYQYGPGCLSDQTLGQWFANCVGLGTLVPQDKMLSALTAVFRHNFKKDLSEHASVQRTYAINDESGLLACTWPNGGRPKYPFPYADEVWTGYEYEVAANCFFAGLIAEGLAIVKGARDRHDGYKRNPWDDFECGHHYARAMSSWSLLLALSGCVYDAPNAVIAFAPKVKAEEFRSLFTAGSGWGTYAQQRNREGFEASVTLRWGKLTLNAVKLALRVGTELTADLNGVPVLIYAEADGLLRFDAPVTLAVGDALSIRARW